MGLENFYKILQKKTKNNLILQKKQKNNLILQKIIFINQNIHINLNNINSLM
jgi:hypothetical protein